MLFKAQSACKKMLKWLQGLTLQDLPGMTEDAAFPTCLPSLLIPITKARAQDTGKV